MSLMKKLFVIISAMFLIACQQLQEAEQELIYFDDYTEFDEMLRQQIYTYWGDVFFYDKDLKQKNRLPANFEDEFSDVFGGNILGVKKLDKDFFQLDLIVFREQPMHYSYEVSLLNFDEIKSDFDFSLLDNRELKFEEEQEIERLSSPSGNYSIVQSKELVAVDFYTIEDVNVPGYLGRYNLWFEYGDERTLMDFSYDRFSTNHPFEFGEFSEDEKYFDYFEWDFARFPYRYDIENRIRLPLDF